jgi:hypothetical protein
VSDGSTPVRCSLGPPIGLFLSSVATATTATLDTAMQLTDLQLRFHFFRKVTQSERAIVHVEAELTRVGHSGGKDGVVGLSRFLPSDRLVEQSFLDRALIGTSNTPVSIGKARFVQERCRELLVALPASGVGIIGHGLGSSRSCGRVDDEAGFLARVCGGARTPSPTVVFDWRAIKAVEALPKATMAAFGAAFC